MISEVNERISIVEVQKSGVAEIETTLSKLGKQSLTLPCLYDANVELTKVLY